MNVIHTTCYSCHCVYTTFWFSIHLLMCIWVVSTFWLLLIMLLWTLVYKYLFESLLSMLLGIYSSMKMLVHMIIPSLIFLGIVILFSSLSAPFYVPSSSAQGFQYFSILTNTCYCLFSRYLIVALLHISLTISGVEQLSMCLVAICISSLEKCLCKSLVHF